MPTFDAVAIEATVRSPCPARNDNVMWSSSCGRQTDTKVRACASSVTAACSSASSVVREIRRDRGPFVVKSTPRRRGRRQCNSARRPAARRSRTSSVLTVAHRLPGELASHRSSGSAATAGELPVCCRARGRGSLERLRRSLTSSPWRSAGDHVFVPPSSGVMTSDAPEPESTARTISIGETGIMTGKSTRLGDRRRHRPRAEHLRITT